MIDLIEYAYFDLSPDKGSALVRCRYCDVATGDVRELGWFNEHLDVVERTTILHMMQCKAFHEVKKSEIEECGI
jgi:hypothetical protein